MNTLLTLENVFIDIKGKLRRGSVELTKNSIHCRPKVYQHNIEVKVKHLSRIENVFLDSTKGIRITTSFGGLIRFGPLDNDKLEETRKFISVNWRKRIISLDSVTKSWIFHGEDIQEEEEEFEKNNVSNASSHSSEEIVQKIKSATTKWPNKSAVKAKVNVKKKFQSICKHSPKVQIFRKK